MGKYLARGKIGAAVVGLGLDLARENLICYGANCWERFGERKNSAIVVVENRSDEAAGVRGEPTTRLRRGWFDVSALVSGLPLRAPNKRGRRE